MGGRGGGTEKESKGETGMDSEGMRERSQNTRSGVMGNRESSNSMVVWREMEGIGSNWRWFEVGGSR